MVNPDFYGVANRRGMSVSRNPYLYQATGQIGLFATYRQGAAVLQSEAITYFQQHA
jgi:predicted phage gp36 major capsid-like protein